MADVQGREETLTLRGEQVAALVRAIRRAYGSESGYGGLEAFHVVNVREVVTAQQWEAHDRPVRSCEAHRS